MLNALRMRINNMRFPIVGLGDIISVLKIKLLQMDTAIALSLFVLSLLLYWHFVIQCPTHTSDVIYSFYPAELLAHGQSVNIYNPLNLQYDTYGFASHGNYRTPTELYLGNPGQTVFYALIIIIFGESSFFYLNGFFGAICVVLMFFLVKRLLNSMAYGLVGALTLLTMPVFMKWSVDSFANVTTDSFFFMAFCCLILIARDTKYVFSSVLISIAIFLRPDACLLILPFVVYILFQKRRWKLLTIFLVPVLLIVGISYPVMDYYLYGDPLYIGGVVSGSNWPSTDASSSSAQGLTPVLSWRGAFPALVKSAKYFLTANFAFPSLVFSLLGILLLWKKNRDLLLFILAVGICCWLFYGKTTTSLGFGLPNLHASFLRYMLPFFMLLPIGFACWIKAVIHLVNRGLQKKLLIALILLTMLIPLLVSINYKPYGILDLRVHQEWILNGKSEIITETQPDDIFISDIYGNKLLFPERQDIFYFPRIPIDIKYQETERVVSQALNESRNLYLVIANFPEDSIAMFDYLKMNFNVSRIHMEYTGYIYVYKVTM